MKLCEACNVEKAKQNNVSRDSDHEPAKVNADKIFINISILKVKRIDHQSNKNNTEAFW